MHPTGAIHIAFCIAALVSGAGVILNWKGTARHRLIGRVYAFSMVGANGSALLIYRLFGAFGPFHVAAILSLATIAVGVYAVRFKWPRRTWYRVHAEMMSWSYVGLWAAAASEVTTRVPASPFWGMVAGATLLVVAGGAYIIRTRLPAAMR